MAVDIGVLRGLLTLDDQLTKKLDLAGQRIEAVGKRWEKVGGQLTSVGSQLNRTVTLPLAAAAGGALTLSAQFETSLTKIETLVGIAGDEVAGFRDRVLELAGETAKAPKELADALFVVTSAGARGGTALEILEKAAKASAAGLGDTTEIARAVTAAIAAYGEENLSASRATDILVATVREGNLEASDLAGSLGRVIGIASQVGVSFEQVGGFVATFTRLGVNAEEAVTALRGVLSSAIAPTEGASKGLLALGTSAEELRRTIREDGLDAALRDLVERAGDNTEALAAVIPNVRALSGVLGTAGAQAETFAKINENIEDSLGILDSAFKRTTETTGFKFQQFLANLKTTGIELGDQLAPALEKVLAGANKLLTGIGKLIEAFSKLPDFVQNTILVLGGLALAAGPVLTVVGNLTLLIGKLAVLLGGQMVSGTMAAAAGTTTLTGAVTSLYGAITALSIGILGPAGIVAALAIFAVKIAEAKAEAEDANLAFANAQGIMQGLADRARGVEDAFKTGGVEGLRAYLETLDPAIVQSQEFSRQVGQLMAAGRLTGEEFDLVGETIRGFRAGLEETAEPIINTGTNVETLKTKTAELDEVLQNLGLVTVANVKEELANFSMALESGLVPTEQLIAKLDEMIVEYQELGVLTPELTAQIQEQILSLAEQGGELTGAQLAMLDYADGARIAGQQLEELKRKQEELTRSVEDFMTRSANSMDQYTQNIVNAQGATGEFVTALSTTGPPGGGGFFSNIAGAFKDLVGIGGETGADTATSLLSNLGSMLKGGLSGVANGIEGTFRGLFSKALNLVPIVGPLLSSFAGPLFDGLKAIGKKVFGWVKGLFGPSQEEIEGRKVGNEYVEMLKTMLDESQKAEVAMSAASGASADWASKVIAIRDSFLAVGKSEQEALAIADELWRAGKEGPEAVQAVIARIQPSIDKVKEAMESTGLTLTELRNKVHSLAEKAGMSTAEMFDVVAEKGLDAAIALAKGFDDLGSKVEEQMQQTSDAVTSTVTKIPETVADTTEKTEQQIKEMNEALKVKADEAASAVQDTFDKIKIEVPVRFDVQQPDLGLGGGGGGDIGDRERGGRGGGPAFAAGTGTGGIFQNFGGGTRAMLHGEEAVITRRQGESLAMMIERAIGAGGGTVMFGPQSITLVADGQKLAEVVIRNEPRVLGNKGLRRT